MNSKEIIFYTLKPADLNKNTYRIHILAQQFGIYIATYIDNLIIYNEKIPQINKYKQVIKEFKTKVICLSLIKNNKDIYGEEIKVCIHRLYYLNN